MSELAIEVYSDYTCPWCYVGTARLDRLRERLDGDVRLDVTWHPFEIHPEVPADGMPAEALGYPADQWERMVAHLRAQAEAEGLEVGHLTRVSNTHRALAAATWARDERPDRFRAFHDALFRAYFGEGRDIGDPGVVRAVAAEAGLDPDVMDTALEAGDYDAVIRETGERARRLGIRGTPTYVFDGRYGAVGAQPVEALEQVARRALGPK
ncbi:MAG: DsbA family oxidoreductase [Longimicrobiales bacterium]|nr:DsbA family oxidoreductase [Longimicrobiales bacterium]